MSDDYPIPDMDDTEDELRAEIARLQTAIEKEEKFTMAAMDKAKAYWAALEEIVRNGDQGIHVPGPYDIAKAALAKEGK